MLPPLRPAPGAPPHRANRRAARLEVTGEPDQLSGEVIRAVQIAALKSRLYFVGQIFQGLQCSGEMLLGV